MATHKATPLLTVTVTSYNYGRYLERNIESILNQSFTDFELLIIDNASTDASLAIIQRFADIDPRIRIIAHKVNQGGPASFRESCDLAKGRYRVQVDADDWVSSTDAFDRQINMLENNPNMTFVYSNLVMQTDASKRYVFGQYTGDRILRGEDAVEGILGLSFGHSGMMLRLDAYREAGGYPRGFKYYDDLLLAVRLAELGDVGYIDAPLYTSRQHVANEHLVPDPRVVHHELIPIIDRAFKGPLGGRMADRDRLRSRVLRRVLVHHPTFHIFNGRPRQGWRMYWESARARPYDTVLQRRTLNLMVRTILGARGYAWIKGQHSA